MATATVSSLLSSIHEGGRPNAGYRFTGGTADDRLTLADIAAALPTVLQYDSKTGILSRVEATPTAYQFLFGSPAPETTIAAGSTATVINVADASEFADTGSVRINNDASWEREIDSISGNAITLASALPSAPNTGWSVKYLEADDQITPDCFIQLAGDTVCLENNAGVDSGSADLGNATDKIVFADYCDVVIGEDIGIENAQDSGNVYMLTENYSWDYYRYSHLFQEKTKITCYAYLIFIGRNNSRPSLMNRNSQSKVRVIIAGHSIHPFADGHLWRTNFDMDVDTQEIIYYGDLFTFRGSGARVPGGTQGRLLELTQAVIPDDQEGFTLSWNAFPAPYEYIIRGLATISKVGDTDQPRLVIKYVDTNESATIIFDKFGGKLGDAYLAAECDDDDCTVEFRQTANFIIQDPAGNAVSAHLKVEAGSYSVAYGGAGVDPVITATDYGEIQEFLNTEEEAVDIAVKVMAIAYLGGGDQTRRNADTISTVQTDDLNPIRYSAWAWGKQIAYRQAFTFDQESGEQDVVVSLSDDELITSATESAVPSAADDFDDIYDMLAKYAFDNEEEIACSVADGVLTFTDADVTFGGPFATLSRSSGTITIPANSTVAAGEKIRSIKATGTVTVPNTVVVTGSIFDSSGVIVRVTGLPAGHTAVIAAWPESQGEDSRENIVTGGIYHIDRDDISMSANNSTLSTVAGDFSGFTSGSLIEIHGFHETENNGEFRITSIAANGLSMVLSRPGGGTFADEAAGDLVRVEDGSSTEADFKLDPDTSYYIVGDAVSYLRSAPVVIDPSENQSQLKFDCAGSSMPPVTT